MWSIGLWLSLEKKPKLMIGKIASMSYIGSFFKFDKDKI